MAVVIRQPSSFLSLSLSLDVLDLTSAKTTFMTFFQFPQNPKFTNIQIANYPQTLISKIPNIQISKKTEYPNIQISEYPNIVILKYPNIPNIPNTQISKYPNSYHTGHGSDQCLDLLSQSCFPSSPHQITNYSISVWRH